MTSTDLPIRGSQGGESGPVVPVPDRGLVEAPADLLALHRRNIMRRMNLGEYVGRGGTDRRRRGRAGDTSKPICTQCHDELGWSCCHDLAGRVLTYLKRTDCRMYEHK
jgi:hypothetical protein